MKKRVFEGIATALVTPFSNGAIDYPAVERLIERQIALKVSALVIAGTTGEAPTLTREEWHSLAEYSVSVARGRVPVLVGAGSNSTAEASSRARAAEDAGADGVLVVTPYYNKASREGLVRHYEEVCASTGLPVIAYNVPSRTGVDMGVDVLEMIAKIPNFAGIKEASGSAARCAHVISYFGDDVPVYSGSDEINLPVFSIGGAGAVSVLSNVLPNETVRMWDAVQKGNLDEARELSSAVAPLVSALFSEVNPIPVKALMSSQGVIGDEIRLPLYPLSEDKKNRLAVEYGKAVMKIKGIIRGRR